MGQCMKSVSLKPCPFCGGTDLHLESFSGWGADVIVCYDCLATFSQQEITCEDDLNIPEDTLNYMSEALGKDSIGLNNLQLTAKYLNLTNALLQNRIRYQIPEYMIDIPREFGEVLIYSNDNLFIPLFEANVVHYYRDEVDIFDVYNDFARIIVHTTKGNADDVKIGYRIFDPTTSERLIKLKRIKALLEAKAISVYLKNTSNLSFKYISSAVDSSNYLLDTTNLNISHLEVLESIEEYYGISFKLSIVGSDEFLELLENTAIIYKGISNEENHVLDYPQEVFNEIEEGVVEIEQTEPVPDSTEGGRRTNLPDITLFNYVFTPDTIMFLPCTVNICHGSKEPVAISCCCKYKIKE